MIFRAALMEMTLQQRELTSALASDLFLRFTNSYSPNLTAAELTERDGHVYSFTCAPSQPFPRLQDDDPAETDTSELGCPSVRYKTNDQPIKH